MTEVARIAPRREVVRRIVLRYPRCTARTRPTWSRPTSVRCQQRARFRVDGRALCGTHARLALGLRRGQNIRALYLAP